MLLLDTRENDVKVMKTETMYFQFTEWLVGWFPNFTTVDVKLNPSNTNGASLL